LSCVSGVLKHAVMVRGVTFLKCTQSTAHLSSRPIRAHCAFREKRP